VFLSFSGIGLVFYYFSISAGYYLDMLQNRIGRRKIGRRKK
jgi:hypothetical protein